MAFGLTRVHVRGFRSARDVALAPGSLCALVGEANAGKSNLLSAIWALLDPAAPPLSPEDAVLGGDGRIRIEASRARGRRLVLEAEPPGPQRVRRAGAPPALFLPAALRSGPVVARATAADGGAHRAAELLKTALSEQGRAGGAGASATAPAVALVRAMQECCALGVTGLVLLVEEPELYLRPQAQRYLYRLLRAFASEGNQVIYSTHSPAFLNVARLEELALVEHDREAGTRIVQPQALPADEGFRALSEFDAERSELFLARAALLVEGRTEKLVFPLVFRALGHDADREAISIVDCGGKPNIALFARICNAASVPYVAVHDRDAPAGREPIVAERVVNSLIAEVAGDGRTVVLEPDFEAVAGLQGHSHKPERAWRRFASVARPEVPEPLAHAAELVLTLARD